ncbi:MAG: type II secretion system protein [Peptostreptococcaceae bacterium]|nr:type II secretion system protein [Peptostreptococcaceae bacterium]
MHIFLKRKEGAIIKNEKGITLIELLVSLVVLSILLVSFYGIFTNAAKLDIRSKNEMTANYLAQQIVAEVKNDPDADWTEYENYSLCIDKHCFQLYN